MPGSDREQDLFDLLLALRDLPELPSPHVLSLLATAAKWPDDWERGKVVQRERGLDAVPPNTECELGAGFWMRLRTALTAPDLENDNG